MSVHAGRLWTPLPLHSARAHIQEACDCVEATLVMPTAATLAHRQRQSVLERRCSQKWCGRQSAAVTASGHAPVPQATAGVSPAVQLIGMP
jgi:hypothetical protein